MRLPSKNLVGESKISWGYSLTALLVRSLTVQACRLAKWFDAGYHLSMRSIFILVSLIALWPARLIAEEAKTNAPAKIPASRAKEYVGSEKIVTGTIVEVNQAEKLVRLNFDKPFPGQTFTAVVFAAKTNLFPDLLKLKGKTVEVSGKIVEYRERPQIVLVATNQLVVVESSKEEEKK